MRTFDVLVVGGGHGGANAAALLRQQKFTGSLAIVGDEPDPPYERPPLSKDYLAGDKPFERILIRPRAYWAERGVELILGEPVVALDPVAREVTLGSGERLGYREALVWATGGAPRRLACSGHDLKGVHAVRNRADVDRMMDELASVQRVVVIGGGYIGLEAAAVLTKLGKRVVVLEAQDRVLARVAGEPLSRFYEAEHRARGVDLRLGAKVDCIVEEDGRATGVRLCDGEVLACEMVVVGIGVTPAVQPLLAAGATGGDGVEVDGRCRTSLPGVYAIGDCARHANAAADGARIRLESVQNAFDQAQVAAKSILGGEGEYAAIPWFWSNQYDLKLQTVGLSLGHDGAVVRGEPAERSFSVVYLRGGRVVALDCVNAARDYVEGKALVAARSAIAPERLADKAVTLKALFAQQHEGEAASAPG